jgi:7-carboxy-7-deazaguanine synthase
MRIAEIFRSIQGEGRLTGTASIFVRSSGCNLRCGYCDTPYASWTPEGEELSVEEIVARVDELQQSGAPPFLVPFSGQSAETPLSPSGRGAGGEGVMQPEDEAPGGRLLTTSVTTPLSRFGRGAGGEGVRGLSRFSPSENGTVPFPNASPSNVGHVVLTGGEPMLFAELIPLTARLRAQGWHITIETAGTLYLPVACDLMSISPKLSNSTPPPERDPRWSWRHTLNRHAPEVIRRLAAEYDCQWKFVIDHPKDCGEVDAYLTEFPEIERSRVMLMPQGTDADALTEKAAWLKPYGAQRGLQFCPRRQIEWFGAKRGT